MALLCNSAVPPASPAAIRILPSVDHLVRKNGVYFKQRFILTCRFSHAREDLEILSVAFPTGLRSAGELRIRLSDLVWSIACEK